jgi:dTDP-4-amino-4,6-dideoxygalactose transaminase
MINLTTVPFVDLAAQHTEVRTELDAFIARTIDGSAFIGGPAVADFERNFAAYCRTQHAVGVSDGTHALYLALRAAGVEAGDLVVTVSHTFIATAEAIVQCGADAIFVDIDPDTYTMSPAALENWLEGHATSGSDGVSRETRTGRRIAAIVPVHLYGLTADMVPILGSARKRGVPVIEDACQAHGAWYVFPDGRRARAGSMGDLGCFSFYPGKNLGAMGEGGAVVTNHSAYADTVRMLRDHGQVQKYVHKTRFGINGRLDALQAGVLDIKLRRLDTWNDRRRAIAARYSRALRHVPAIRIPHEPAFGHHVYHLYVVLARDRAALQAHLQAAGVQTGLHYPIPVHLQEAYADCGYRAGDLPVTERVARELLSLPMFPHMTDEMVDWVVTCMSSAH